MRSGCRIRNKISVGDLSRQGAGARFGGPPDAAGAASCILPPCCPVNAARPVAVHYGGGRLRGDERTSDAGVPFLGADRTLPAASDTFINSHNPDNNNGASLSIFTGRDGMGGVMRGLIRFELPARLQGRVTVTGVQLTLTTRGLGPSDTIVGTAATESVQAVSEAWAAGNGAGNSQTLFVVGESAGAITGATWNQPSCGTAAATWSTAGGSVVAAVSAQALAPAAIDSAVTWDAASAGNAGLIADVQGWIDAPASNRGWRITSSTEGGANGLAQRLYATEAPANAPALALAYDCKTGFAPAGDQCTTCAPNHCRTRATAPQSAPTRSRP